jgi:osmotically-inducible protein OsmY
MDLLPALTFGPATDYLEGQGSTCRPTVLAWADDGELATQVEQAIRKIGYPALRNVSVSQRDSAVILSGPVPSYYLKQLAQAAALTVSGVERLQNDLDVIAFR